MQFLGIRVTVANGSNVVRAVWRLTIGTKTGTFTAGETVTWSGGGSGIYLSDTGNGGTLYMTRTAGPEPEAGTGLTGGSSGATVTVASLVPANFPEFAGNPPRFADSPQQGPILPGQFFFIQGQPIGLVGSAGSIARDTFHLAANWGGTTYDHANAPQGAFAVISRSFTPIFGFVVPESGDRLTADVVRYALFQVETRLSAILNAYRAKTTKGSDQSVTATSETDITGLTGLSFPSTPDGTKLYRITYNLSLAKSTAAGLVTARLYVGTNGNVADGTGSRVDGGTARQNVAAATDALALGVASVVVQPTAGQKLGLSIQTSTNGVTVDGGTAEAKRASFVEVEELFGTTAALALPAFTTLTKSSPFANVSGESVLAYLYNAFTGEVVIKGAVDSGGSSVSAGADIVSAANALPSFARPSERLRVALGGEPFSIETDGSIKYRGPGGVTGMILFNGLTFRAA
jgi:hypothetical protein